MGDGRLKTDIFSVIFLECFQSIFINRSINFLEIILGTITVYTPRSGEEVEKKRHRKDGKYIYLDIEL